jgi:hypothetical protein
MRIRKRHTPSERHAPSRSIMPSARRHALSRSAMCLPGDVCIDFDNAMHHQSLATFRRRHAHHAPSRIAMQPSRKRRTLTMHLRPAPYALVQKHHAPSRTAKSDFLKRRRYLQGDIAPLGEAPCAFPKAIRAPSGLQPARSAMAAPSMAPCCREARPCAPGDGVPSTSRHAPSRHHAPWT